MDSSSSAFHPHIQESFHREEGTRREKYQHSDPHLPSPAFSEDGEYRSHEKTMWDGRQMSESYDYVK